MVMIIMVFAQLERKMTAERTSLVMLDRISKGQWNGGHLYGYRPDSEGGKLVPDPEWAPIIQNHFFNAVEKLGSAGAVQRELRKLGIRTPVRESRAGNVRGGKFFSKQQVIMILRNPLYIGRLRYGDQVHEGLHESIITPEQFDRVQRLLDETTKRRTNHRYDRGHVYLLGGLVRCGCGAMMTPKGAVGRTRTHHYYECTRQIHGGGTAVCSAPRIQAEALDRAVKERVVALANNVTERERIAQDALKTLGGGAEQIEAEITAIRHHLAAIKGETQNLLGTLRRLGERAAEAVSDELDRLGTEREGLEERLKTLEGQSAPRANFAGTARQFIEGWGNLAELLAKAKPEEQRAILQHYVEVVELRSVNPAKKGGSYALRLFPGVNVPLKSPEEKDLGSDEQGFDQSPRC
jgi:site-specific DNA recombinase